MTIKSNSKNYISSLIGDVINQGMCVGCGACTTSIGSENYNWHFVDGELIPIFKDNVFISEIIWEACPGKGINYGDYLKPVFNSKNFDSRLGFIDKSFIGFSNNSLIRMNGASGGVITSTLLYLFDEGFIDGAILARQCLNNPKISEWFVAVNRDEIISCSQSIYVNVPMLESLPSLHPGKRYAITTLPEQTASLRILQKNNIGNSQLIKYILGPYTGTYLKNSVIDFIISSFGINKNDGIHSFKWRAGEWPGYLSIKTNSGKTVQIKKVYYNYLIPFFINNASLQSMDFANELTDLSVGDAWSPVYEQLGQGFSVVISRNRNMTDILLKMVEKGYLKIEEKPIEAAADMHGHMIDFKKRGAFIRNKIKFFITGFSPDYGYKPKNISASRWFIEIIILTIFLLARTRLFRFILFYTPKWFVGPMFNFLRLSWKNISKPTKRKGLRNLTLEYYNPRWISCLKK